jgi:hypothetical protein
MTQIDLVDYASQRRKISATQLNSLGPALQRVSTYQLSMALLIDFLMVLSTAVTLCSIMRLSLEPLLVTPKLQQAALHLQTPFLAIFGLTFFSYYFTVYFFNHGQSYGSFRLKFRAEVESRSMKSSLRWIALTAVTYLTCGFGLRRGLELFQKNGWGNFVIHDSLYHQLMLDRTPAPLHLLTMTQESTTTSEDWFEEAA